MNSFLLTGEYLRVGEYRTARNNACFATMQRDGNFCLYAGADPAHQKGCIWASSSKALPAGDYFAVMQHDGNFCVYRGIPGGATEFVWSTGTVADGRQFFFEVENGGVLTVNKGRPDTQAGQAALWASRRLRLMTFNTHLIENSNVEAGARITSKLPVVFHDAMRYSAIVEKIKQSGADIVALQEVWSADRMDAIREALRGVYPFSERGTSGPPARAGSGIVILSKFPMEYGAFKEFKRTSQEDSEDSWATKGVRFDTIVLPDGGAKIRVGMTHAWTNAGSEGNDSPNIVDLTGWTIGNDKDLPTVFMGDFNIKRLGSPVKHSVMHEHMVSIGARDSWVHVHGTDHLEASTTDDQINNNLNQFFSPDRDTPVSDCLDYIYLRDGKETHFRPIDARVVRDWTVPLTQGTNWYWVHQGTTEHMPTAAVVNDTLCVVSRSSARTLQVALMDRATRKWTHDTIPGVNTSNAPGIVWFAGCLHLFFEQGGQVFKMESKDGAKWTPPQSQGNDFRTSGCVCPVVHNGTLYVFCRDPGGAKVCFHKWTNRWEPRVFIDIVTKHDISAASLNGKLCVVTIDNGSGRQGLLRAMLNQNGTWQTGQIARGVVTTGSPGIVAHNGKFEVFYNVNAGGDITHLSSSDGENWSAPDTVQARCVNAVHPVVWDGKIMVFFAHERQSAEVYSEKATAHMHYPPRVDLDLSDHYPYCVDLVWPYREEVSG